MLLLAISLIAFFIIYQRRLLVEQDKINQMETSYQRELMNAGVRAQEAERKRIASDLHDSVGGMLSATKLYISQLKPDTTNEDFDLIKKKAVQTIDENISTVRGISHNLLPPGLERLGLVNSLDSLCKQIHASGAIDVQLDYNEQGRFKVEHEMALYRITQELISNTLKHADATEIEITVNFQEQQLSYHYADNGRGFNRAQVDFKKSSTGLGMKNIETRIRLMGATFEYDTDIHKGFHASIMLPIT